jgi:hypothetical protein
MRLDYRITTLSALAIGTLALSACGGGDTIEAENESAEAVADRVADAGMKPNPGRWESEFKIVKMDMPGMPAELKGMMDEQIGQVETSVSCLTKEEAEKSEKDFFRPPERSGEECKYNSFKMGGGRLDADMTCEEGNATQNMRMSGTYGPDAYKMNVKADGNMGEQKMSMEMEIASKRVGDCDGSEKG